MTELFGREAGEYRQGFLFDALEVDFGACGPELTPGRPILGDDAR